MILLTISDIWRSHEWTSSGAGSAASYKRRLYPRPKIAYGCGAAHRPGSTLFANGRRTMPPSGGGGPLGGSGGDRAWRGHVGLVLNNGDAAVPRSTLKAEPAPSRRRDRDPSQPAEGIGGARSQP